MQTAFALLLFAYCINLFILLIGTQLGIKQLTDIAIPDKVTQSTVTNSIKTLNSTNSGGFNVALIFGDWLTPLTTLINIVSFGAIINLISSVWGFPVIFVTGLKVIFGVLGIMALIYMISGRGILNSI